MTEVEYNRLLQAVAGAVGTDRPGVEDHELEFCNAPPSAANDNQLRWPLLPFPKGWTASC